MKMNKMSAVDKIHTFLKMRARFDKLRAEISQDMVFSDTLKAAENALECLDAEIKVVLLQELIAGRLTIKPEPEEDS
jgi:hypothetical protein